MAAPQYHNHNDDGELRERGQCARCDALRPRPPHTIFKYEVDLGLTIIPKIPLHHEVIAFAQQGNKLFVWVQIDTAPYSTNSPVDIEILVVGTGEEFDAGPKTDSLTHIDTIKSGPYVWHAFKKNGAW